MAITQEPVVIVGAGQAGVQIAESLRQEGHGGTVLLIGSERHPPYHRPPLSKKWLAQAGTLTSLAIRGADALIRRQIELKSGVNVTVIDRNRHLLTLSDGTLQRYEKLALATGARPRNLPLIDVMSDTAPAGVFTLRSIEDSARIGEALRACADSGQTVAVVGGGFIGLEVAAAARKFGADVIVFEAMDRLMSRVTAPIVSDAFARLHTQHGVQLQFDASVSGMDVIDGAVRGLRTADGAEYPVGCVIVGIGVIPDDAVAVAAGLACERGIIVDDCGRTSDPHIVAAGDCTARRLTDGRLVRLESVHNAVEQGKAAAAALMGRERPFVAAPWFWSDQFEIKLQLAGLSHGYDEVVTRGDVDALKFSVFYFRAGRLIACDSLNRIHDHLSARKLLDRGVSPTPAQVSDGEFELQSLL